MSKIQVPNVNELNEQSQTILANIKKGLGMVPNLYATIGYSSNALDSYLAYDGKAGSASYNKKELEVIRLAVSEVNQCQYCLSAHTAIAKMNGFNVEETLSFRSGVAADPKLNILAKAARELAQHRGQITDETRAEFFNFGLSNADYIELIAAVNAISFTNFVHNATDVPIDFPAAQALEA